MSEQGWIDANVPPLTLKTHSISGGVRKERVTATKPFERDTGCLTQRRSHAYHFYYVISTSVYCIIRATVLLSQKAGAYKTAIDVNRQLFTEAVPVLQVVLLAVTLLQ